MAELRIETCVDRGHPSLPGHFPGHPLVPGVVLLDLACAQARALCGGGRLAAVPSVKFLAPVRPDQPFALVLEAGPAGRVAFRIEAAGALCAQGSLQFDP